MKILKTMIGLMMLVLLAAACGGMQPQVVEVEVTRLATESVVELVEEEPVEVQVEAMDEQAYEIEEESADFDEFVRNVAPEPTPLATGEPAQDMFFAEEAVNPFIDTRDDNLSTFAVDVDTGSYTLMRGYVQDNVLPPSDAIRVEEFVNYFDQQYPLPAEDAFAIHLEGAPAPYGENENYHLVRVGIQGYDIPDAERPNAMLIFVIDVSGSMSGPERIGLVQESLHMLVDQLEQEDYVGLVTYGSTAEVVLEPTPISESYTVHQAIDRLAINGSTNMEDGLRMAYNLAEQYYIEGGINRLIVASDGVANVGSTTAESILRHAKEGIQLSTFGYGMGNYSDVNMEQLADQGDGTHAYIDSMNEAERVFKTDLLATLFTIAKDAKIQVEFNSAVVDRYRLIGYENRDVADSDFRNDSVDAGEIGSGHSVTALYEVRFAEDYNENEVAMTVRVRYEDPEIAEVVEISQIMAPRDLHNSFVDASATFQLSAVVAEYAEILRDSYWARESDIDDLAADARRIAEYFPRTVEVQEFEQLVAIAARLK